MVILFDGASHNRFLPITYTRAVADLLIGIGTIRDKWEKLSGEKVGIYTRDYLQKTYPTPPNGNHIWISASVIPGPDLLNFLKGLTQPATLKFKGEIIGYAGYPNDELTFNDGMINGPEKNITDLPSSIQLFQIKNLWDLYKQNQEILVNDFKYFTEGLNSAPIPDGNTIIGDQIFLEEGAMMSAATINTTKGPVYLSKNTEIMEGALIRGGLFLGENSTIKMGAKLYGALSIGSHCKIGGEVNNSIIHDYSNKGHDGYLGNSIVGSWCNFGADTNSSNLKNTYENVSVYDISNQQYINSGEQFLGLIMGDHSKTGINTMLNTGTVIGISANIFGANFPPKYIPSFAWGGGSEWQTYLLDKALNTVEKVMARKQVILNPEMREIFAFLFEETAIDRKF